MSKIYQPSEDSFLMSRILKQQLPELLEKKPDLKFLEIGVGSGINLQTALESGIKKENIFSSDIDQKAVDKCNFLGLHCTQSNLFENFDTRFQSDCNKEIAYQNKEGRLSEGNHGCPRKYDLIIFNPPYLPEDKREPKDSKLQTTGGKKGNEIINEFLKQAKNHLEQEGKIFLITSSLSEEINFKELGYKEKEIGCEKLFFEKLCVLELFI